MKSYFGTYTRPGLNATDATVLIFDKKLSIGFRDTDGSNQTIAWNIADTESSYLVSLQQSRLRNTRFAGHEILIDGKDADDYVRSLHEERQRPWHARSSGREWIRNTLLLLAILGGLFILYLLIVPWLSSKLASKVSVKTERQLGDAVYDAMGLSGREDTASSFLLNEFFAAMEVETAYDIRITVVKEEVVNAFALPGGRIVVYNALLKQINSYHELAALLSHEFIHINNKHATRSIFRRLGSKVFLGLLFGRLGTVTSVLVDHADNLKSLSYSRKLEKEADREGVLLLVNRDMDPHGYIDLFRTLEKSAPSHSLPEILASHPDIGKRIQYIQDEYPRPGNAENAHLESIFEKIKN